MNLTLDRALPIIDAAGVAGIPVLLRGGSGIGKSSSLNRLAQARDEHLEVVTASLYEAVDFGGMPITEGGVVNLAPMPWVRRVCDADRTPRVVFDEMNTAPQPVQAALLRVLLERISGDTALPEQTRFVAAINPTRASAGGWDLPAPVAARFLHLDIGVDAADWAAGMLSGWTLTPPNVTCLEPTAAQQADALARVTAFVSAHPHLLHDQPETPSLAAGAWPSPRKWDWVARILPALPTEHDLPLAAVEGLVGRAAADTFFTWVEKLELPDTQDVLDAPTSIDWAGQDADRTLAILNAVVAASRTDADTHARAGAVLHAVVAADLPDLVVPVAKPYLSAAPAGATPDKALLASLATILTRAGRIS